MVQLGRFNHGNRHTATTFSNLDAHLFINTPQLNRGWFAPCPPPRALKFGGKTPDFTTLTMSPNVVTGVGLLQWTRILPSAIIMVALGGGWPASEPPAVHGDELRDQLQFIRPACRKVEWLWAAGWEVRQIKRGRVLPFTYVLILASPFISSVHYLSPSLNFCVQLVLRMNFTVASVFLWRDWVLHNLIQLTFLFFF